MTRGSPMSLIEGLPDAITLECLARLPYSLYRSLCLVSRSWRDAIQSQYLFKARINANSTEDLLCVSAFQPENLWQLYDPSTDVWMTLPPHPSTIKQLKRFGTACIGGNLFIIGGGSDGVDPNTGDRDGTLATNEVWSYDPVRCHWSPCAPMLAARTMFACCSFKGRIVVAGGLNNRHKAMTSAEAYDPELDIWVPIPNLCQAHNLGCSGLVVSGKVHVMHKGTPSMEVWDGGEHGWEIANCGWPEWPAVVAGEKVYFVSHGRVEEWGDGGRAPMKVVGQGPEPRGGGFGVGFIRGKLFVVGGWNISGMRRSNMNIELLADVDMLDLGEEELAWRRVAPMTRCRGTVVGCTSLRI
ncbi:hypothetical protein AMTRI_Chr03g55370 [Amborella trichopoda]|nr:F-box/kelch-repeat protein SKIP30 isoform X2 [Amborella trichopoda]|eukprot:XP_011621664.1 F-box/kelch-repeat protein SKIP30 isoform X2 [Amborella trichopoda]